VLRAEHVDILRDAAPLAVLDEEELEHAIEPG